MPSCHARLLPYRPRCRQAPLLVTRCSYLPSRTPLSRIQKTYHPRYGLARIDGLVTVVIHHWPRAENDQVLAGAGHEPIGLQSFMKLLDAHKRLNCYAKIPSGDGDILFVAPSSRLVFFIPLPRGFTHLEAPTMSNCRPFTPPVASSLQPNFLEICVISQSLLRHPSVN